MANKKEIGKSGEDSAAAFLEDKGFTLIERNFRFQRAGEIDIIARKDNLLIFVEVKKRNIIAYGGPLYSINKRKKSVLRKIAQQFLYLNPEFSTVDIVCRFDLITVVDGEIEWHDDIIR